MKQCKVCGTTYTDDSLRYCLADGGPLIEMDEQATVVRPGAVSPGGPMRVMVGGDDTVVRQAPPATHAAASSVTGGSATKIIVVVVILLLLVVAGIAGVGAIIYFSSHDNSGGNRGGNTSANNKNINSTVSPTPSPMPTATETSANDLSNEIANLKKQIEEQKNANRPSANTPNGPTMNTGRQARVNSPGDGFLALRSLPSSDLGYRITQIPNGAAVTLGVCFGASRLGNKNGHWCQASYNGFRGWVFDAWLNY